MGQEPAAPTEAQPKPAKGQEPKATEEGQEPKAEPQSGTADTFEQLPAETQQEIKSLRTEAAKHRKEAQEARAKVEEFETANASDLEKANKAKDKAEKEAAESKARLLRYEVATEKNVPAKLVPLLTASSKEDLEAQADLILENAKAPGKPADFDGGAREPAPEPKTPEEQHNDTLLEALGLKQ
jgi:hypothetical protein